MDSARESPVISERDRDDRSKVEDSSSPFPTRLPPPVAMSLRTRESSSLALKHIFDQINASADNPQPVGSLFGRTVAGQDKRDDDGKREGPGISKEVRGTIRSAGPELDSRQRAGGVCVPINQVPVEERVSFRFKSFDSGVEEATGQQQGNRGFPPQGFAEKAQSLPQVASQDSRCGFLIPERATLSRFQDADGSGEYVHKGLQEDLANVSPRSIGVAALPQDFHLRKRLPELDLSFRKAQSNDSTPFLPAETAFGSPISTPSQQSPMDNVSPPNPTPTSWSVHRLQQGPLPQAVSRSTSSNHPPKKPTAQLTIFYSGMVNVYDDVPADKANAIMLLAGNGNSWSTNHRALPVERESFPQETSSPSTQSQVAIPANVALGTASNGITPAKTPTVITSAKTFSPPVAANSSICTSNAPSPNAADPKPQTSAKRAHTGIELPHARKASLARFLEKRKERVPVKQQAGSDDHSKEKLESESVGSPKRQRSTRSRPPSDEEYSWQENR